MEYKKIPLCLHQVYEPAGGIWCKKKAAWADTLSGYTGLCDNCAEAREDSTLKTSVVRGLMLVVRKADGQAYIIDGKFLIDLINDWDNGAVNCPASDERVLFFMYNGEVVNSNDYTDFESVIRWMKLQCGDEF